MANLIKSECKIVQHQKGNHSENLKMHEFEKHKGSDIKGHQEDHNMYVVRSQK